VLGLVRRGEVCCELDDIGIDDAFFERVELALAAAAEAQEAWEHLCTSSAARARMDELEEEGIMLREQIVAACKFHLRKDSRVQRELLGILDGEGAADLSMDLITLSGILMSHQRAFRKDKRFDAREYAHKARSMAREVREELMHTWGDHDGAQVRDVRDRAFTHLEDMVAHAHAACCYRFYADSDLLDELEVLEHHLRFVRA